MSSQDLTGSDTRALFSLLVVSATSSPRASRFGNLWGLMKPHISKILTASLDLSTVYVLFIIASAQYLILRLSVDDNVVLGLLNVDVAEHLAEDSGQQPRR